MGQIISTKFDHLVFRHGGGLILQLDEGARRFLDSGFSKFIEEEWLKNKAVYCEYAYDGTSDNRYENPLFYAAYYCALRASGSNCAQDMLSKARGYIIRKDDRWVYGDPEEYFVNSLAWLADGIDSGIVKDLSK